ncbi:PhzF family phenazine biosynthesis protein [Streptomyces sp. TLI_105]|uniref:PhzF family phenazine biosynthesis protein n=1 Tax=Streptomyces sp. TLI_105 TaxID=1881019 RepID=UPI00089BABF7|nr:PhzF family phenazine biosynthesis protein [Streptomyces sp. TLI_105]SED34412.1 phenazine biosynthesis protein PhzF family [Streptomyces sp. TLI_105]
MTVVQACVRDGRDGRDGQGVRNGPDGWGGSPTAVMDDGPFGEDERRRVPGAAGASHAVFVAREGERDGRPAFSLRFFTSEGELPSCGHGTIAALGFLAARAETDTHEVSLRVAGRTFTGRAVRKGPYAEVGFAYGAVELREPAGPESALVLPALGLDPDALGPGPRVASVGRPRLLVPVASRAVLAALAPDMGRLRAVCDRLGLLGCYVYSAPSPSGRLAARMFAPSIGVPEDIANANSTACLAAHLAGRGIDRITVDMGDSLGSPATIGATTQAGPSGPVVRLGGGVLVTPPRPLP